MVKQRNDNAFMLIKLQDKGVKLAIIASKSLGLKGTGQLSFYEDMDGIPIHRLYRQRVRESRGHVFDHEQLLCLHPLIKGGWGFIGDCWSMKTPVVMTHNDNYVTNNVNALVAENEKALIQKINLLYEEPELYKKLQSNGYEESKRRRAEIVSNELYTIFTRTIEGVLANKQ